MNAVRWIGGIGLLLATACGGATDEAMAPVPAEAVRELLAQDQAFGEAASRTDVVSGLTPMFSPSMYFAVPDSGWLQGVDRVLAALRANPDNAAGRLTWAPIRGGVSADGTHGFTFGYMTFTRADSSVVPMKYLSYWVRDSSGWHVMAWRRRPRAPGDVVTAMMPPFAPAHGVAPTTDPAVIAEHQRSVAAAEQGFSDEAQRIGLGAAFARWGRGDAINLGGPDAREFIVGAEQIGAVIGAGDSSATSSVWWNADYTLAASSGDLGITFGLIRDHSGTNGPFPFFTVWARETSTGEWRYIAE